MKSELVCLFVFFVLVTLVVFWQVEVEPLHIDAFDCHENTNVPADWVGWDDFNGTITIRPHQKNRQINIIGGAVKGSHARNLIVIPTVSQMKVGDYLDISFESYPASIGQQWYFVEQGTTLTNFDELVPYYTTDGASSGCRLIVVNDTIKRWAIFGASTST